MGFRAGGREERNGGKEKRETAGEGRGKQWEREREKRETAGERERREKRWERREKQSVARPAWDYRRRCICVAQQGEDEEDDKQGNQYAHFLEVYQLIDGNGSDIGAREPIRCSVAGDIGPGYQFSAYNGQYMILSDV